MNEDVIEASEPKEMPVYGWWISFLCTNKKDFTPIVGNGELVLNFKSIESPQHLNVFRSAAAHLAQVDENTQSICILNYKRLKCLDTMLTLTPTETGVPEVTESVVSMDRYRK